MRLKTPAAAPPHIEKINKRYGNEGIGQWPQEANCENSSRSKKIMADEPVSRILCDSRAGCATCVAGRRRTAAIIPLGHASRRGSSSLPEGPSEPGRLSPPIWPCTTRGFPCPRYRYRSGGLLPHLFTLTGKGTRSRRCLAGLPASYHRAAPTGGLSFCGTVREPWHRL